MPRRSIFVRGSALALLLVFGAGCASRSRSPEVEGPLGSPDPSLAATAERRGEAAERTPSSLELVAEDPERHEALSGQQAGAPSDGSTLPGFRAALRALERGGGSVRIVWFGDSHTAADYLTGVVRSRLQSRFGDGGPGFVPVGTTGRRHSEVSSLFSGIWRRAPKVPTASTPQDDGVFGLSGLRAASTTRAGATVRWAQRENTALRWELVLRPRSASAWARIEDGGESPLEVRFRGAPLQPYLVNGSEEGRVRRRGSQLWGVSGESSKIWRLAASDLDVFGLIAERTRPGVVLDALGINGARLRTLLAWDEGSWLGELAERDPALVVLAYGTNEAGEGIAVPRYAADYQRALERVRAGVPSADCLLVGPTDRADQPERVPQRVRELDELQRQIARELGCGYFSLLEAMGGIGGFGRWASSAPPLASADGVHLTIAGYQKLGEQLADVLSLQ